MTSTVIDSLVISLGLDAKGVVKGAQQTEGALKRLRARLTDNAKGIEQAHTRVAESVRNVREQVLGLLTVVTAGRGLNAFFQETSANVIATRNFSQTIDTSTASLGKWEAAARMAGGSAEGIRQTFASISSSIAEWDLNKTFSSQLQQMQRSGIAVLDGKTGNASARNRFSRMPSVTCPPSRICAGVPSRPEALVLEIVFSLWSIQALAPFNGCCMRRRKMGQRSQKNRPKPTRHLFILRSA